MSSEKLKFADEIALAEESGEKKWQVLVVDDEESIHAVTRMTLIDYKYQGRGVNLTHVHDSRECRRVLASMEDLALIILDVVMDEHDAGLKLVQYIRETLGNHFVRIILRTGQPGQAPAEQVIHQYDINDYKEKTELTADKLRTSVTTALRSYVDLIELEKQREELEKSRVYQNCIMDAFSSLLITVDQELRLRHWNRRAENLFRLSHQNSEGRIIFDVVPSSESFADDLLAAVERGQPTHLREIEIYMEKPRVVDLDIYPVASRDDALLGAVVRVVDVTELKVRDDQVRHAQKMEALGSLVAGLVHDINNALVGITGSVSLLELEDLSGPARENLETISMSANNATSIVKQLLNLARNRESGFMRIDLARIVSQVARLCRKTIDPHVRFSVDLPETPAVVRGDVSQLEQVLLNLCINASHAMTVMRNEGDSWGGDLKISLKREEEKNKDVWMLTVSDTGVGMDPVTVSRIFDPFFTTKEDLDGSGLGLSMVFNIITNHGGEIHVDSTPGEGSRFTISLPSVEGDISFALPETDDSAFISGEGRILLCDDELLMRRVGQKLLEKCGYEVVLAEDGAEAVELYEKEWQNIDGVILDIMMPKLSGIEVFNRMREINPGVKAILSSGFGETDRVDNALKTGLQSYLAKPFTLKEMSAALSFALSDADEG